MSADDRARHRIRIPALFVAGGLIVAACGDDSTSSGAVTTTTTSVATTTSAPSTTTGPATTSTTPVSTTTSRTSVRLDQPALWPAPAVVFPTPEEAAADFVRTVLGVEPVLGEFAAGDARSGEIEVFAPAEADPDRRFPRSLLGLRRIGPTDGWYVIFAHNDRVRIDTPDALAVVPAGPVTVTGAGRGFEGNVVLSALVAGTTDVVDERILTLGAFEEPEPYEAVLDLTDVAPGTVVTLLVRGGTGLESDPGEFSAIPVTVG